MPVTRRRSKGEYTTAGADRAGVLRLVVREGMTVRLSGITAGVVAAVGMTRALSTLVFGVSVWDPVTYAGVSAVLALVVLSSCVMPAVRASTRWRPFVSSDVSKGLARPPLWLQGRSRRLARPFEGNLAIGPPTGLRSSTLLADATAPGTCP
jgi:hypothetical protein